MDSLLSSFIKKNQNKLSLLFIVVLFAIITCILIYINSSQNILGTAYRDVYFYLIEALRFSGVSISGYAYVNYLSPLVPFLTSILFRLGMVSETSIFIVTGLFYFLEVVGFYYLLKLRFNNLMAVCGTVIFGGLTSNLLWAGNGTIDIPAIALSIWAIYFMIKGFNSNSKYFILAIPIGVLAFFGKYTAALIFPLMVLYYIFRGNYLADIKKYFKSIFGGVICGGIVAIPFFAYFILNKIPFGFINQASEISSKTTTTATVSGGHHVTNNLFYYLTALKEFIYNPNHILSYIIILIGLMGLCIIVYKFCKSLENPTIEKVSRISFLNNYKIGLALSIIIGAISFFTAGKMSFIINEGLLFISLIMFSYFYNKILDIKKYPYFSLDLLMFTWYLSYLVFFSSHLTKVARYFTAMAPGFIYIIILSLNLICKNLTIKLPKIPLKLKTLIPIVLIIVFVVSSFGYLNTDKHVSLVDDEQKMVEWIEGNIPNYGNMNFSSIRGPIYTWYLQEEVKTTVHNNNSSDIYNQMVKDNISYYISTNSSLEIPNTSKLQNFGNVTIYKRV